MFGVTSRRFLFLQLLLQLVSLCFGSSRRRATTGTTGYFGINQGKCGARRRRRSSTSTTTVDTKAKCLEGQLRVGWKSGDDCGLYDNAGWGGWNNGNYPAKCHFNDNTHCGHKMQLSPKNEGDSADCSASNQCICELTASACPHQGGLTKNTEQCVCKNVACATITSTGSHSHPYCIGDTTFGLCSTTPLQTCPNTNGAQQNTNANGCLCGDVKCAPNLYCDNTSSTLVGEPPDGTVALAGKCRSIPTCPNQNPSAANVGECICGNVRATANTYCASFGESPNQVFSFSQTATEFVLYTKNKFSSTCTTYVTQSTECDDAAAILDMVRSKYDFSYKGDVKGCYVNDDDELQFNDHADATYGECCDDIICKDVRTSGWNVITCPVGQYLKASQCHTCPSGYYATSLNAVGCSNCEFGKFQEVAMATEYACKFCSAGKQYVSELKACTNCDHGMYQTQHAVALVQCKFCLAGKQFVDTRTACTECLLGEYQDQVNQTFTNCSRCLLGKYSDEMGSVHCKFCPAGSYSTKETGSIACTNCPKGTYNEDGRTVTYDDPPLCIKCEAGRYQDVDGADNILMCQECEIYTYNPFLGQASCQPCKTNLNTSSTSCSGCNPGTYLSNDGITCTTCELGLYTEHQHSTSCTSCPAGYHGKNLSLSKHQAKPIHDSCDACPRGYYGTSESSATLFLGCKPCVRGRFSTRDGLSTLKDTNKDGTICDACVAGRYSETTGRSKDSACKFCTAGSYSTAVASNTPSNCQACVAGKYNDNVGANDFNFCKNCPAGYQQSQNGKAFCLPCTPGSYSDTAGSGMCKKCAVGRSSYNTARNITCDVCSEGRHQPLQGTTSCLDCIPGKNQPQVEQIDCIDCLVGRASSIPKGEEECAPCSKGRYQNQPGSTHCLKCIPGQYQNDTISSTCKNCKRGKASSDVGREEECAPCSKGRHQNQPGSTHCLKCIPGQYQSQPQQSVCKPCEKGKFAPSQSLTSCTDCPAGQYAMGLQSPNCFACDAGQYTNHTRSVNCSLCPMGYNQPEKNQQQCLTCSKSKYQQQRGSPLCKFCPPQSTTVKRGATSDAACVCDLGNFASRDTNTNLLLCQACPPRSTTSLTNARNVTACICNDGFWKPRHGDECLNCPNHATCLRGSQPVTELGYWKVPWRAENINPEDQNTTRLPCLYRCACLGFNSANDQCPEEEAEQHDALNQSMEKERCRHFHAGPLCAACKRGSYKEAATFRCLKCFDALEWSILFIVVVILGTLLVIAGMTVATVADHGKAGSASVVILKIAVNSSIISACASSFPLAWPKIVVTMFQMYAVASASAIGDSLSADCVLRASEMRPVQAWALTMLVIPPCCVVLWVVVFGLLRSLRNRKKYLKIHLPVAIIVTLIFTQPVVTKSAVKLVACRTVAGRTYLDADFSVDCAGDEYRWWALNIALPMFVVYTFGVPLAYAVAMYRHIRKGTLEKHRDIYGFFFSGFRQDAWWFELWNTVRKSIFTISAVIFAPAGVMMQTWAALVLLLLFYVVFLLSQPYSERYLNKLERKALGINISTLLLGLGLFTNEQAGEAHNAGLAVLVTCLILSLNILFVLNVGLTLCRHSHYCERCGMCKRKKFFQKPHRALLLTMVHPQARAASPGALEKNDTTILKQTQKDMLEKEIIALRWQKNLRQTLENLNTEVKSRETDLKKVEEIEKNHETHRNMALKNIEKKLARRRSSLQVRLQARNKVKHSNVLLNSSYFSNLDSRSISKIIDAMDYRVMEENDEICRQGDIAAVFYIIVSGTCNVTIDGALITVLTDLDVFGEQALFEDEKGTPLTRGATVTTSGRVQLLALSNAQFKTLLASGTLNKECMSTLKRETEKRVQDNEAKRRAAKSREKQKMTNVDVNANAAAIRKLVKKTIKTVDRFRKIVIKLSEKDGKGVDGKTKVKKAVFRSIVEKVGKFHKIKIGKEVLDLLWATAAKKEVDEVGCKVLEVWMGLV